MENSQEPRKPRFPGLLSGLAERVMRRQPAKSPADAAGNGTATTEIPLPDLLGQERATNNQDIRREKLRKERRGLNSPEEAVSDVGRELSRQPVSETGQPLDRR